VIETNEVRLGVRRSCSCSLLDVLGLRGFHLHKTMAWVNCVLFCAAASRLCTISCTRGFEVNGRDGGAMGDSN
jgi:hypothetical protein